MTASQALIFGTVGGVVCLAVALLAVDVVWRWWQHRQNGDAE